MMFLIQFCPARIPSPVFHPVHGKDTLSLLVLGQNKNSFVLDRIKLDRDRPFSGIKKVGGEVLMERVVSDAILLRLLQAHHPKYAPVAQRVEELPKELQPIEKDAEPDEPGPEKVVE